MKQTSIEWLIEQFKEYDFTPASNNEEYVIIALALAWKCYNENRSSGQYYFI